MTQNGKLRVLSASVLKTRLSAAALADRLFPLPPDERLRLIEQQHGPDAGLRYLAYALPEREAVWWCCMCLRHVAPPGLPDGDVKATRAAEHWVRHPGEDMRRTLLPLSREADASGPAAFALRAAIASRPARPDSTASGLSASQSILRAAALFPDPERTVGLARFRASALDIAAGGAGWIESGTNAPSGGSS